VRALTEFAQRTVSPRPLAVARIGVAIAILLEARNSGVTMLQLSEPGILRAPWFGTPIGMEQQMVWGVIALWLAAGFGFLLGAGTRLCGALLTATLIFTLVADQQLYSNHLYLMALAAGLLTLADSGAALSLDAVRHGGRDAVPAWPVTLLKLQVSILYAFAALAKLNPDFLSGSVVATYLRREGPLAVPQDWRFLEPMLVLAVLAVSAEAFLAIALWSRRWRGAAFVVGLGLHVGIAAFFSPTFALAVFSLLSLPLYVLFLDARPGRIAVVWDDGCGFCATWVKWFRRLDWLDALRPIPRSRLAESGLPVTADQAARALQAVEDGRVRGGFSAVVAVFETLPLTFLFAALFRLPPVAYVGERWYRRVAARRLCELPDGRAMSERAKALVETTRSAYPPFAAWPETPSPTTRKP